VTERHRVELAELAQVGEPVFVGAVILAQCGQT
jgi:hypothetical protein